jgi:hypothetical protein
VFQLTVTLIIPSRDRGVIEQVIKATVAIRNSLSQEVARMTSEELRCKLGCAEASGGGRTNIDSSRVKRASRS